MRAAIGMMVATQLSLSDDVDAEEVGAKLMSPLWQYLPPPTEADESRQTSPSPPQGE
jgi:hypothetical protein